MTNFLLSKFLKNVDPNSQSGRQKYGLFGAFVGVLTNLMLFIIKLLVGIATKSVSVTADAFNNLSDTLSSLITIVGFKLGAMPADEDHPFGHGRMEYFSGLIVSILVGFVGLMFLKTSFEKIIHPQELNIDYVSLALLVFSILVKILMSRFNYKIGDRINSSALKAAALDAKGDVMISSTVVAGLLISKIFNLKIDGFIGLFVAFMIIKAAWGLIVETVNPLLGEKVDEEKLNAIEKLLTSNEEIYGTHDTVIHNYGPNSAMGSTHVEVRDDISLVEIHDIIDELERRIREELSVDMVIHIDPVRVRDSKTREILKNIKSILINNESVKSVHDMRIREESGNPQRKAFIAEVVIKNSINSKEMEDSIKESLGRQIMEVYPDLTPVLFFEKDSIMLNN